MPSSLSLSVFFFNDTATTEIYTLSLHDALPICHFHDLVLVASGSEDQLSDMLELEGHGTFRSEEHTSELQSHLNLVCRLLLEKKKKNCKSRSLTPRRRTRTRHPD